MLTPAFSLAPQLKPAVLEQEKLRAKKCLQSPVLIIDDDPHSVELARHVLTKAKISNPAICLNGGKEGIAYLEQCIAGRADFPLFVFLDLNMPGIDGYEVLNWMRRQPALRRLLTVVLSFSTAEQDAAKAFAMGADAYLPKFPPVAEIQSIFQLANAMFSVEELEKVVNWQ